MKKLEIKEGSLITLQKMRDTLNNPLMNLTLQRPRNDQDKKYLNEKQIYKRPHMIKSKNGEFRDIRNKGIEKISQKTVGENSAIQKRKY